MSERVIDELTVMLGFEVDPKGHAGIIKIQDSIRNLEKYASIAASVFISAAGSFAYFSERSAKSGAGIERFSRLTGMSTEAVQGWAYASQIISGHKETMLQDAAMLTESIRPMTNGQFNTGLYAALGPNVYGIQNVDQLLHELNHFLSKMTPEQAFHWGDILGISHETVLTLQQDPAKIESLLKRAKAQMLTPAETQASLKFAQMWDELILGIDRFAQHIVINLMPLISSVITRIENWTNTHNIINGIELGINGITNGVNQFFANLSELKTNFPSMKAAIDSMMNPRMLTIVTSTALAGISLILGILAGKYLILGALVLGILAAGEDLTAFLLQENEDTLTRRMLVWLKDHAHLFKPGRGPKDLSQVQQKSLLLMGSKAAKDQIVKSWGTDLAKASTIQSTKEYDQNVEMYIHNAEKPEAVAKEISTRLKIKHSHYTDLPKERIEELIQKYSKKYGVSANLIRSVMKAESGFKSNAISSAGAQGLMQLMPKTARGLGVIDSFDPEQNIMGGTRYLAWLIKHYHGDVNKAIAAYNWGEGRVDRNGLFNLPAETRAYLKHVNQYRTEMGG